MDNGVSDFVLADLVADVVEYMGIGVKFITENEVIALFLAGSVVAMALGLFGKAKRVVRK